MKPILFNTEMVRAVLEVRKTVTRRVVKPQPTEQEENPHKVTSGNWYFDIPDRHFGGIRASVGPYRPPYHSGDILYVRETFFEHKGHFFYKADGKHEALAQLGITFKWHPSVHMPRAAARIFLRVTDVRVERLQMITENQAKREGAIPAFEYNSPEGPVIVSDEDGYYIFGFKGLWDSTIKKADRAHYGWAANPWVWVIEFERCEPAGKHS